MWIDIFFFFSLGSHIFRNDRVIRYIIFYLKILL